MPKKKHEELIASGIFEIYYENLTTPVLVTNSSYQVIYLNTTAQDLIGYPFEEIENQEILNIIAAKGESQTRVQSLLEIIDKRNQTKLSESDIYLKKRSGRTVPTNFSAQSLNYNGTEFVIFCIQDLTEIKSIQKSREESLKQISHMSKLADVGRLAAGIAHELNNPLMIIMGYAENLQVACGDSQISSIDLNAQLTPIIKASERMSKVISTMMKLARDEEIFMVPVELVDVVEDILSFLESQISLNEIEIEKDLNHGFVVNCDPSQIEQIIINIVNNAIHALKSKNSDRRMKFSMNQASDGSTALNIWNNGPPIPDKIKNRIMSPFFTTKSVGEGTGLGLSLSYGIMKAHGGDLNFVSNKSDGTQFLLSFPATDEGQIVTPTSRAKILIVDDESYIRKLLIDRFKGYGYEVLDAEDGFNALEKLKTHPDICCVFTDIRMPRMNGNQLIKQMRKSHPDKLVFAISAYIDRKNAQYQASKLRIDGVLTKPIDQRQITEVIRKIEEFATDKGLDKKAG